MGITKLQSRVLNPAQATQPGIIIRTAPVQITSIMIDGNALAHTAAGIVCGYAPTSEPADYKRATLLSREPDVNGVSELDKAIARKTSDLVHKYIDTLRPTELVYLAFDGRVPMTKINQQRKRRLLGARARERALVAGTALLSTAAQARLLFDSTVITPGTPFMALLDDTLMRLLPTGSVLGEGYRLVYSSYRESGEGEHKIMDLLRDGLVPATGARVIISADSDMVVLAATVPTERLYVYRDTLDKWVDISQFRHYLRQAWGAHAPVDLVMLLQVLGNDFVPPQPSYYPGPDGLIISTRSTIKTRPLENFYREINSTVLKLDDEQNLVIDWVALRQIFELLAEEEYDRLFYISRDKDDSDPRWSNRIFPRTGLETMTAEEKNQNMEFFRAAWYDRALSHIPLAERPAAIVDMVEQYLKTLTWTSVYYLEGYERASSAWSYPYHYPPLFRDIVALEWKNVHEYVSELEATPEQYEGNLLSLPLQLLAVMPLNEGDSILDIVRSLHPDLFPVPSSVEVDSLGMDPNEDNREISAVILPVLDTETVRALVTDRGIQSVVDDQASVEELNDLLKLEYAKESYTDMPTIVLERRPTARGRTQRRPRITEEEVEERLAREVAEVAIEPANVIMAPIARAKPAASKAPAKAPMKAPPKSAVKAPAKRAAAKR